MGEPLIQKPKDKDYSLQSVTKVLAVIDILGALPRGARVTTIAERLKIAKSSAHRFLTTLEKAGYVVQDQETGRYRLTFKLFELGSNLLKGRGFNEQVAYLMERLSLSTGCVVKMGVHEAGRMLCVYRVNAREVFRMDLSVGSRLPLHCTGLGKAYLSSLKDEDLAFYARFAALERYTPNTITTVEQLLKEISQSRAQGYALDKGEHSVDVWCVAAAVVDHLGHTVSALSISGPASVLKQRDLNQLGREVKETARKISVIIGYS